MHSIGDGGHCEERILDIQKKKLDMISQALADVRISDKLNKNRVNLTKDDICNLFKMGTDSDEDPLEGKEETVEVDMDNMEEPKVSKKESEEPATKLPVRRRYETVSYDELIVKRKSPPPDSIFDDLND